MNFLPKGPWDDLRRKVEETLGLPLGSTTPIRYRSSPENEAEMARRLLPYVEDERKAAEEYHQESELADLIGRPDIAATLEGMSRDEHRHYLNLEEMLRDLRRH